MDAWLPTNAVAWYGAIVATGSLIIGVLNFRRDRTRLRVKADANTHTTEHDGPQIVITVANIGRRPVHLQTLPYFTAKGMGKGALMVKGQWHPTGTLQEGQSAVYFCNQK